MTPRLTITRERADSVVAVECPQLTTWVRTVSLANLDFAIQLLVALLSCSVQKIPGESWACYGDFKYTILTWVP